MAGVGTPTYDQLRVFLCVVDLGSFAAAARRLNRAVSVVSYTIGNLEAQLGLVLFERAGTRRPQLTDAGQAVLSEARAIARGMDGLKAKAAGLLDGLEAEVNLAVDVMLPAPKLAELLKDFSREFPTVTLRLHAEALGAVMALVLEGRASVGISGPLTSMLDTGDRIERSYAGCVELVPVAAPDHPLARLLKPRPGAAQDHVQLVLTDRSSLTEGRDFSVASARTWRLADLSTKHALLREGIGWGNMPLPMVEADLESGALVRLNLPDHRAEAYAFEAIWRAEAPPGPAAAWVVSRVTYGI